MPLDEPARHEAAHAVRDDHETLEVVARQQLREGLVEVLGDHLEVRPRRVVIDPGLEARAVELAHEVVEARRRAADAVHEQDRHAARIVGLEEVDSGAGVDEEIERLPQPVLGDLLAEARIGERGDLAGRGELAHGELHLGVDAACLELLDVERDREGIRHPFRDRDGQVLQPRTRRAGERLVEAERAVGLARLVDEVAIAILERGERVASRLARAEAEAAGAFEHEMVDDMPAARAGRSRGSRRAGTGPRPSDPDPCARWSRCR
jgi:hypothetical protein